MTPHPVEPDGWPEYRLLVLEMLRTSVAVLKRQTAMWAAAGSVVVSIIAQYILAKVLQ